MSFQHYKGVRISLVSRSDIRYEGTLDDVNPDTSSIALTNVRSFGTEGRKGNPLLEVAPQDDKVFPYICFRASDVKDLNVLETGAPAPVEDDGPPADPAIIDYQPPKPRQTEQQSAPKSTSRNNRSESRSSPSRSRSRSRSASPPRRHHHHQNRDHHHQQQQYHNGDGSGAGGYRGGRGGYRGGRGGHGGNRPAGPVIPKGEFNFDESNAKLDKEAVAREFAKMSLGDDASSSDDDDSSDDEAEHDSEKKAEKVVIPPRENFYDKKSSFFDNISCEAKDRAERGGNMDYQQRRQRMHQERRTNMETFGVSTAGPRFNNRGGHRGGHRGGYRGGYEGGRGGYEGGRGGNYRGPRDRDNVQA